MWPGGPPKNLPKQCTPVHTSIFLGDCFPQYFQLFEFPQKSPKTAFFFLATGSPNFGALFLRMWSQISGCGWSWGGFGVSWGDLGVVFGCLASKWREPTSIRMYMHFCTYLYMCILQYTHIYLHINTSRAHPRHDPESPET